MIIRLPIDIKSLYLNIKNDNECGHTATVATPLKQYGSCRLELTPILDIPENINQISREKLIESILSHSRAEAKINKVFVFDRLLVNGIRLTNVPSFCVYIREETAVNNIHCGRQKIHYPLTFKFEDEEICIDNNFVMKSISNLLHNYAFIVEAFEYNTETNELNFDIDIVGENNIPYSKVFVNKKGVGNKFTPSFNEDSDVYDLEIIALREKLGFENVSPVNYLDIMENNKKIALEKVKNYLEKNGADNIRNFYEEYPYSLYDIEYTLNGKKYYTIVKYTATKNNYFKLPIKKIKFCNDFSDDVNLILVTDLLGNAKIRFYKTDDLNNMEKSIESISYNGGKLQ